MKEQLEQYLVQFAEQLKSAGEFTMEQLPLFVQEYLAWGFAEAMIWVIILLIVSGSLIKLSHYTAIKAINYKNDDYWDDGEIPLYALSGISGVISIFTIGHMINNILIAIKISIAPRVYLIENLLELVK